MHRGRRRRRTCRRHRCSSQLPAQLGYHPVTLRRRRQRAHRCHRGLQRRHVRAGPRQRRHLRVQVRNHRVPSGRLRQHQHNIARCLQLSHPRLNISCAGSTRLARRRRRRHGRRWRRGGGTADGAGASGGAGDARCKGCSCGTVPSPAALPARDAGRDPAARDAGRDAGGPPSTPRPCARRNNATCSGGSPVHAATTSASGIAQKASRSQPASASCRAAASGTRALTSSTQRSPAWRCSSRAAALEIDPYYRAEDRPVCGATAG